MMQENKIEMHGDTLDIRKSVFLFFSTSQLLSFKGPTTYRQYVILIKKEKRNSMEQPKKQK